MTIWQFVLLWFVLGAVVGGPVVWAALVVAGRTGRREDEDRNADADTNLAALGMSGRRM